MENNSTRYCRHCGEYMPAGAEHVCVGVLHEALKRLEGRVANLEEVERRVARLEGVRRRQVPLSPRENRVLSLVAEGKSNKEIAGELGLSAETVKNFMTHIFTKLDVRNRTEAALKWRDMGLR